MTRSTWVKAAVLVALVIAGVVLFLVVGLPDRQQLRSLLDGLGAAAVPAFIGLYFVVSLFPIGPSAVLTVVGGVLLGFWVALGSVLVAAVAGSAAAFAVSRALGRDAVRGLSGDRLRALDRRVGAHGFASVLVIRLVPVLPFTTLNYALGLTSISWRAYLPATALGILPGTALYVAVGAFGTEPGSWPFVLAVIGLIALSLVGVIRGRRDRGKIVPISMTTAGRKPTTRADKSPESR